MNAKFHFSLTAIGKVSLLKISKDFLNKNEKKLSGLKESLLLGK